MRVLLVPGHTVDRFVVVRLLGEGSLARVYLVKHRKLGSEHALKLLHLKGERAKARFLQERQVQARIRHANIVPVTDIVEVEQSIGLVMDFVDGPSLAEILTGEDTLSRRDIPGLFDQICQGVHAAHAGGVLHCDLKPANILIAVSRAGVQARITDFGIVKAAADLRDQGKSLTEAGTFMGTLGYTAPEQLSDAKAVDVRADVFSLGCIVYEMLAGKSPYTRRDRSDTIRATLSGEHQPIADAVPGLPKALAAAIERAIHPLAGQRFETADALRLAVGQAFRGYQTEPVEADYPVVPDLTQPTDEAPAQKAETTAIPDDPPPRPQASAIPTIWAGTERQAVVTSRGPGTASWLALGVAICAVVGGLVGFMAHEQVGVIATADANAVASANALGRPWTLVDSRLVEAIRESPNRLALNEAAADFAQAPTVEERIGKARELVRAVRNDIGTRASAGGPESPRLQVANGALDPVELSVKNAEQTLIISLSVRTDWSATIADIAGWTQPESSPGRVPVHPLAVPAPFVSADSP